MRASHVAMPIPAGGGWEDGTDAALPIAR